MGILRGKCRRLAALVSAPLFALLFALHDVSAAPNVYTTVSASAIQNASGTRLDSGTITFTPVSSSGQPIDFMLAGGGISTKSPVSAAITEGAFSVQLADTGNTTPAHVCYRVEAFDSSTGSEVIGPGYTCFQPTGATIDFDLVPPDLAPYVTVEPGPQGPPGAAGGGSIVSGVITGTQDGTNTGFTLAANGFAGVTASITFTVAPVATDQVSSDVLIATTAGVSSIAYEFIYINGIRQRPGIDYTS